MTDPETNYFRISAKPSLTQIGAEKKIEVKAKSPLTVLNYEGASNESPSNGAPFAQKVADLISKKLEPVDDVYGLE